MIAIAIVKTGRDISKAASHVKIAASGIAGLQITVLKNLCTLVVNYPDDVSFEEIKRIISSCDDIRPDAICQDAEIHLIQ